MKILDDVYTVVEGLSEHDNDYMLETFGKDLELVLKQVENNHRKVWTLVDSCGGEDLIAIAGYHLVNRINYVITEEEWKDKNEEYVY